MREGWARDLGVEVATETVRFEGQVVRVVEIVGREVGTHFTEGDLEVGEWACGDAASTATGGEVQFEGGDTGDGKDGGDVRRIGDESPVAGHAVGRAVEEGGSFHIFPIKGPVPVPARFIRLDRFVRSIREELTVGCLCIRTPS